MRLTLILAFLSFCQLMLAQEMSTDRMWTVMDVDEGEKPTLTIDINDVPHIAYIDEAFPGFVKLAKFSNNEFESTLVTEGYFYGPIDLAFNPVDNTARIGYHDHDEEDYAYATQSISGDFTVEFIESPGHDGWDNTIFIEDDGTEHLLSTDSGGDVEYASLNESNEWVVERTGISRTSYRWATDIEVVNGIVYAVAYSSRNDNLMLATKEEGVWDTQLITASGRYPSLDVDDEGGVMIAYFKKIEGSTGFIEVAQFGSAGLEFSVIDTLVNFDEGNARNVVKVKRQNEGAYVGYSDTKVFKLASLEGDDWQIETVLDFTNESTVLRNMSAMDIDSDGYFHLSTYRAQAGAAGGGMIMYITDRPEGASGGSMEAQVVSKSVALLIEDPQGNAVPSSEITMTSMGGETTISEISEALFSLAATEAVTDEIQVCITSSDLAVNGVSSTDVVRALRIVLGLVDACPDNLIAADVNEDGNVSSVDLVNMINIVIGNANVFPRNPSWVFLFNDEQKNCETYSFSDMPEQLTIKGIKKGNLECLDESNELQEQSKNSIGWKY